MFELKKNGQVLDNLSTKKLNQSEIDKLIGVDEKMFKCIVGIAVTNNKPFLSMSLGDKRGLVENIFNLTILSEMSKEIKKRNTVDFSEQRIKIAELDGYNRRISDNKTNIEKIQSYIDKFEEHRQSELTKLNDDIIKLNNNLKKSVNNIRIGEDKIKSMNQNLEQPSVDEMTRLAKGLGMSEHERDTIIKTLKSVGDATVCPICGSVLDEGDAKRHLDKLKSDLKTLNECTIPNLKRLEAEYNAKKNAAERNRQLVNEITIKIKEQMFNKANYEKSIEALKNKIVEIKNNKCELSVEAQEALVLDLQEKAEAIQKTIDEIEHKIEVDSKLMVVLGDDGLRLYFYKKLLPVLNHKINHYLQKFEMPVQLEFDCYMNETIKTGKFPQEYNQFSGGERCRIDMAILLSFLDIAKILSNWSCSILMIDEILDAGVDQDGISQFISTLYNIVTEENKDLGIYVISHKLSDVQVAWNEMIEITKKSLYSELRKI